MNDPDQKWRAALVSGAAGLVMLVSAALVLWAGDGPMVLIAVVLAVWGLGGMAFSLAEILHLRG